MLRRHRILGRVTIPREIIHRDWAETVTVDRDTIEAKDEIAAGIEAATVDAGGAGAGDGVVEEEAAEATGVIRGADGICHRRSTHHHMVIAIRAVTTIDGLRAIAVQDLRDQSKHGKMTLFCRVSRWRNIAGVHSKLRLSRSRSRSPKNVNLISSSPWRVRHLAHSQLREGRGGFLGACHTGCWRITKVKPKGPGKNPWLSRPKQLLP